MFKKSLLVILACIFSSYSDARITAQKEIEDYQIGTGEKAILNSMKESFANIRKNRITKENMDECERHFSQHTPQDEIWRIQVIGSTFAYKILCSSCVFHDPAQRIDIFKKFLKRTIEKYPLSKGIDFFISFGPDKRTTGEWSKRSEELVRLLERAPFFLFDMSSDDEIRKRSIQIPDFFIQSPWYADTYKRICEARGRTPYEKRKDIIKWRGVPTGIAPTLENLPCLNRCKLVLLSKLFPSKIDASFNRYAAFDHHGTSKKLKTVFEILQGDPSLPIEPSKLYTETKYNISLDGNIAAWERVAQILTSGSVLLLQYHFSQYFYHGMKPFVHYVPLKEDISDVFEKYEWLQENPVLAQKIAENGQKFADECLTSSALEKYFGAVLAELSKHYVYTLTESTLDKAS